MGYLRLLLALAVMVAHIGPRPFPDLRWWHLAVWVFFAISGYLMTLLMQGPYKGRPWVFLLNRCLRIYPAYWVVLLATLAGFAVWGEPTDLQAMMGWPQSWEQLWLNALLLLNVDAVPYMPVATAWTLGVEMLFYLLIAFGLFGTAQQAYCLALVSLAGCLVFPPWYNDLRWAMFPFSVGASAYWLGLKLPRDALWAGWAGALSYPVYLVHYPVGGFLSLATGLGMGWALFGAALPPTLALSWALVVFVERPVSRFRKS